MLPPLRMAWCDLLFAHWPIAPEKLRPLIPGPLEIDTFDGQAWLGVVPFRMENVTLLGSFPELNLRTYVRHRGRAGVWFFSLDAAHRLAVRAARLSFHLPYFDAEMKVITEAEAIKYYSNRIHQGAPAARFTARYEPSGPVALSKPGTLEHWQTERYCLFSATPKGRILRGDVEHVPWPLQPANAQISQNTLGEGWGLSLDGPPATLAFARRVEVKACWPVAAER